MKALAAWFKREAAYHEPIIPRPPIVIKFECRGCMASDHRWEWIGELVEQQPNHRFSNFVGTNGVVRVLKHRDVNGDIRDHDLGTQHVVMEDGSLQLIRPGLYFYYK